MAASFSISWPHHFQYHGRIIFNIIGPIIFNIMAPSFSISWPHHFQYHDRIIFNIMAPSFSISWPHHFQYHGPIIFNIMAPSFSISWHFQYHGPIIFNIMAPYVQYQRPHIFNTSPFPGLEHNLFQDCRAVIQRTMQMVSYVGPE
jgi:hypothetical protein